MMPKILAEAEGEAARRRRQRCRRRAGRRAASAASRPALASHRSMRAWTRSRPAAGSSSSASRISRGFSASSPSASRAIAAPCQRSVPSPARTKSLLAAVATFSARSAISPASAFCAAARSALASGPSARGSGAKRNPSRLPTCWPSTRTSPVGVISASSIAFSFSRRISTLVRRSTKRAVSRSCSASDRRSSIARVRSCQWPGSRKPVRPIGGEGPGADMGDAVGERVDVAVGAVGDRRPGRRTSRRR